MATLQLCRVGFCTAMVLSSQKGQAEVFFLVDKNGQSWILKKFYTHCALAPEYLRQDGLDSSRGVQNR